MKFKDSMKFNIKDKKKKIKDNIKGSIKEDKKDNMKGKRLQYHGQSWTVLLHSYAQILCLFKCLHTNTALKTEGLKITVDSMNPKYDC